MNTQLSTQDFTSMSSTEIAEFTGKRKADIHRDIKKQLFQNLYGIKSGANMHLTEIKGIYIEIDDKGFWSEVRLDKEHTLTLVTGYDVHARHNINKRWMQLEQERNESPKLPQTYLEALKELVVKEELIIEQQKEIAVKDEIIVEQIKHIEVIEPKAKAIDNLRAADGCIVISEVAKQLGFKRKDIFSFLNEKKWIFKRSGKWLGYDTACRKGLLDHRPVEANGKVYTQCVVTPKGLAEIAVMVNGVAI